MKRDAKFLTRRTFLRGAGGVAVGLPLLESIGPSPLRAQTGALTKRFLCVHYSSGIDDATWWPEIGPLTETSLLGTGMEPLTPFVSRMLVARGVHGYPVGTWTGHLEAMAQPLTAASHSRGLAQSISIDQVIAQTLQGREALVLKPGGRDRGAQTFNSISYIAPGQLAAAESDPARAFRSVMGAGALPLPVGGATDGLAERLAFRQQSVLDAVRTEFEDLQALRLGVDDRLKLDRHFTLVRDVEIGVSNPDLGPVGCALNAADEAELGTLDPAQVEANANFPLSSRLHVKVAALALACGYTRSAVLQWGAAVGGSPQYVWDGLSHQYRHHPLSHGTTGDGGGAAVPNFKDQLAEIDFWNMGELAKLLTLMDSYPEADGRTLLDNTVVLVTNEFSNGQGHTTGDLPIMVFGGAGYFKLGEQILISGSRANIAGVTGANGNSNKMLATVLNAMDVPTAQWGNGPAGEFDELKA